MACIRKQEFDLAASLAIVCLSRHKVKVSHRCFGANHLDF